MRWARKMTDGRTIWRPVVGSLMLMTSLVGVRGAAGPVASPEALPPDDTPTAAGSLSSVRFEQKLGQEVARNSRFLDEDARARRFSDFLGRPGVPTVLVFTYFRCPNLCTLVLNGLVDALRDLPAGRPWQILAVSIDPREGPPLAQAKRRSYLARLGRVEGPWHFLTGREPDVRELAASAGFHYRLDPLSREYSHPSGIVVIDPAGRIIQYFFGIQFDPARLDQALRKAAQGKVGNLIDEILLYCFHYDPLRSRHGPRIMLAIRVTGALGAAALLGLLVFLSLRPRSEAA